MTEGPEPREAVAIEFIAGWARRHPDYTWWQPHPSANDLAAELVSDVEFPGVRLGDFLGRVDTRAIQSAVATAAPFGRVGGIPNDVFAQAMTMAVDKSCSGRRVGWTIASVAGLAVGALALFGNRPSAEGSSGPNATKTTRSHQSISTRGGTQMKRVFIAFAKEDERIRDLIKGQSLNDATPFEYVDLSVKEPYTSEWKERVRTRIRGSDGVIALLSRSSLTATGELWEIQCAVDEKKPLLGLHIYKEDRTVPDLMRNSRCIVWSWDGIASFVNSL